MVNFWAHHSALCAWLTERTKLYPQAILKEFLDAESSMRFTRVQVPPVIAPAIDPSYTYFGVF